MPSIDGGTAPEALHIHLEDRGVMDETVNGGEGHGGVREDFPPLSEGLVCSDEQ